MPLATLGTFILWLGWFGFNGGSQLAMGTVGDIADVSRIFSNTNAAAAGGVVCAMILTQVVYGKVDLTMALNGALAGLVSITAEPLEPTLGQATLIGAVGGAIVVFTVPLLDKMKIDDVVGAIPVHLFAGIWGTLAVLLTNGDATFMGSASADHHRGRLRVRHVADPLDHPQVRHGYSCRRGRRGQRSRLQRDGPRSVPGFPQSLELTGCSLGG